MNIQSLKPKQARWVLYILFFISCFLLFSFWPLGIISFLTMGFVYLMMNNSTEYMRYKKIYSDYHFLKGKQIQKTAFNFAKMFFLIFQHEFEEDTPFEISVQIATPLPKEVPVSRKYTTNSGYELKKITNFEKELLWIKGKGKQGMSIDFKINELKISNRFERWRRKFKSKIKEKKIVIYDLKIAAPLQDYRLISQQPSVQTKNLIQTKTTEKQHILRLKAKKTIKINLNETANLDELIHYLKQMFEQLKPVNHAAS